MNVSSIVWPKYAGIHTTSHPIKVRARSKSRLAGAMETVVEGLDLCQVAIMIDMGISMFRQASSEPCPFSDRNLLGSLWIELWRLDILISR